MLIRRATVGAVALSAVLLSACDPVTPEDQTAGPPTPGATGTPAAAAGPFNYCDLVDPAQASQVADDLGDTGGEPLQLVDRWVDPVAGSETCEYAVAMADLHPVRLTVSPDGALPDLSPEAEAREDLGEGAYFEARFAGFPTGFVLAAPVADVSLTFYVEAEPGDTEPEPAEEALRGLLDTAAGRLPADPTLADLVAGEDCEQFEQAAARGQEGPPDHSRYVAADGSFSCEFTSLAEHWRVGIKLWLGGEAEWRAVTDSPNAVALDLADAWLIDVPGAPVPFTQVYVFTGPDLIRVDVRGTAAVAALAEDLAAEVVPIITGE